jgi:SAM-dependent methyltransferase
VQGLGLGAGVGAELPSQRLPQELVGGQGGGGLPGAGVGDHHRPVRRLVERVGGDRRARVPEHHPDLFEGTERFFRPGYVANLVDSWIPSLDGVQAKLAGGARVADVGCGHGASTILMATALPRSTFVGFDYHRPSIEQARKAAADAGVSDRCTFEVAAAKDYPGEGYDLVAVFDALHDMGDPVGAAAHMRRSLAADGTFLLVEPAAGERVEDNLNPVGRIFYSASTLICVPNALSQGGPALGSQVPEARLRELLAEAGFGSVRRAAETPFNRVLEARP